MAGIRINSRNKKIDINDDGDYIVLRFDDQRFAGSFYDMVDSIRKRANELNKEAEKYGDVDTPEARKAVLTMSEEMSNLIAGGVDRVFGEGTCRKLFGDVAPVYELFVDFFEQLQPYFEEYARERDAKMSKYTPARQGNV